ncbi:hypothetical protein [Duganella radicis]|uniref:Uncharacterized protein n=1 Tax=Duganella radicis TaxID=551988 RepID=A0A6L6PPA6_9BURK|nr:hypothetical protein [Duganella radicis]MTV40833.1 hypothetical protein [Duganella radicis]
MKKIQILLAALISLGSLQHQICTAGEAPAAGSDCATAPERNPAPCMDAACAARAKAELDRALACHKAKMAELAASSTLPKQVDAGGIK